MQFAQDRVMLVKDKKFDFEDIHENFKKRERSKVKQDTWSHTIFYWVVMLFLFLFSVTIMASCVLIRCWEFDQAQSKLMLCAFTVCWEKNITVSIHKF